MKRAILALALILIAAKARADQTWTQNQHATNLATGAQFSLDGLPAPVLGKFSPLRLDDLTLCAGGPLWVNATGLPFRCATIGNTAGGADLQAPLAPADGTIVMPTAGTIRVGAVPGTGVTGTPNTVAYFNGSGVLNSLTLASEFALTTGTLSIATGGITTAKLATNAVANGNLAQMPALSMKANPTNATANAQDMAATGANQVPITSGSGTSLSWQTLNPSLAGVAASWGSVGDVRYFAADAVTGNDNNTCFSDVSQAASGLVACKTISAMISKIARFGEGRSVHAEINNDGAYSSAADAQITLTGMYGYYASSTGATLVLAGTGTNATAGAVAFAGDANDSSFAGFVTATGMNSAGYNPTVYSVISTGGAVITAQLAGGGAPTFPSPPAYPYGARLRFDASTATVALRNKAVAVIYTPASNQISLARALTATPSSSDVFYLEMPGVTGPTTWQFANFGSSSGGAIAPVINGINFGSGATGISDSRFTMVQCSGFTLSATDSSIQFDDSMLDVAGGVQDARAMGGDTFARRISMIGGSMTMRGAAIGSASTTSSLWQGLSWVDVERSAIGSGVWRISGQQGSGNNILVTLGTNSSTTHGASVLYWASRNAASGFASGGLVLYGSTYVGRSTFTSQGSNPAIRAGGEGLQITLQGIDGSSGNGDVGMDLSPMGVSGNNQGCQNCTIAIADPVTVTGSTGDVRLCDGTIITWTQAKAGIVDPCGNSLSAAGNERFQATTTGPKLPQLAGVGTRLVTADASGVLVPAPTSGYLADPGNNGIVVRTGPGTTINRTLTNTDGTVTFVNPDGVAGSPIINTTGLTPSARTVTGTAPISIAGDHAAHDLSANRTWALDTNGVTYPFLQQGGALSIPGRASNSLGNWADISATAGAGGVLRESGSTLGFGSITEGAVTNLTTDLAGKQPTGNYITALNGDVTAAGPGSAAATLHNIPNGTTQAGAIDMSGIAFPGTPGTFAIGIEYFDSTSVNAAVSTTGGVKHMLLSKALVSHQFLTGVDDDGTVHAAQVLTTDVGGLAAIASSGSASDLVTGTVPCARAFALTGDVTSSGCAATIAANAVTNAKAAQMAANTIKGNNTGSTANALDLTATQVTAMLNPFSSSLQGLAPASGGGSTNFLRADGTWAAPPAGSTVTWPAAGDVVVSNGTSSNPTGDSSLTYSTGTHALSAAGQILIKDGTTASPGIALTSASNTGLLTSTFGSGLGIAGGGHSLIETYWSTVNPTGSVGSILRFTAFPSGIFFDGCTGFTGCDAIVDDGNDNIMIGAFGQINIGSSGAFATNNTHGFLAISSSAGVPTGTPTALLPGKWPLHIDSTDQRLYTYDPGAAAWRVYGQYDGALGAGIIQTDSSGVHTTVSVAGSLSYSGGVLGLPNTIAASSCTNCNLTYDSNGRLLSASNGSGGGGGGTVTAVTASSPLASSGGSAPNITLSNSGVAAGTYVTPTITVDATGRVTSAGFTNTYQLIESDGVPVAGEATVNFHAPLHAADNSSPFRTEITINDFFASGSSHARGIVPDPGSTAGSRRFLNESAAWIVPLVSATSLDTTPDYLINKIGSTTGSIAVTTFAGGPSGLEVNLNVNPASISPSSPMESMINYAVRIPGLGAGTPGGWWVTSSNSPEDGAIAFSLRYEYPLLVAAKTATLTIIVVANSQVSDTQVVSIMRNGAAVGSGLTVTASTPQGTELSYTASIAGGATSDTWGVANSGSGADVSGELRLLGTLVVSQ